MKLISALEKYQKDCFAACFDNGRTQCGFRRKLGDPFDSALNDVGTVSASPAISRLRTCPTSGWFSPTVPALVANVFKMCSSSELCSAMCSGDSTNVTIRRAKYAALSAALDANPNSTLSSPSSVAKFVKPISTVVSMFALSLPESIEGLGALQYVEALTNPAGGKCGGYDQVMVSFVQSTGQDLSPYRAFGPSSSLVQIRAVRDQPCAAALAAYERVCGKKAASAFCVRAGSPRAAVDGVFDSCDDKGLWEYYAASRDYNDRCVPLGLPERPTNGPIRHHLLPRRGQAIHMADCFQDNMPFLEAYIGIGLFMWAVALGLMWLGQRWGRRWLAGCDVTMDVCCSRAFTVFGTLWLLYAFYSFYRLFLSQVPLRVCSTGLGSGSGLCSFYFPTVLYLFLVALLWVAAFGWVMAGNNPYRAHPALWSVAGVLLSNAFTVLIVYRQMDLLDQSGGLSVGDVWFRSYQSFLICFLQLALDATFVVYLCVWPALGMETFHDHRNRAYSEYIHGVLDREPGREVVDTYGDAARLLLTCTYRDSADGPPTARDVQKALAAATLKARECFIVIAVRSRDALDSVELERARRLGRGGRADLAGYGVCTAEVMVSKLSLSQQDEEARGDLLRAEAERAGREGRDADRARLLAGAAACRSRPPPTGLEDALLLTEGLRSPLFVRALQSGRAEAYWGPVTAALREFVRVAGNGRQDRSSRAAREAFREAAAAAGVTDLAAATLCSLPEADLVAQLHTLRDARPERGSATDEAKVGLERIAWGLFERARPELLAAVEDGRFLQSLEQPAPAPGATGPGGAFNEFSVATTCLDAFHFEHFRGAVRGSTFQVSASAARIVEELQSQVEASGLRDAARGPLRVVLWAEALPKVHEEGGDPARKTAAAVAEAPGGGAVRAKTSRNTFLPSILFVCVGIAAIITSQEFVSSLSSGLKNRDLLYSAIASIKDLQAFIGDFAVAALDVLSCVDPSLPQTLQSITPLQYADSLRTWPPLVNALAAVQQDPSFLNSTQSIDAAASQVR